MKLEKKKDKNGALIKNCWINKSGYTVALVTVDTKKIYQITAPRQKSAFAYVGKNEVKSVLIEHMKQGKK